MLVFLTCKESERGKRGSQPDKISNFFSLLMWWWWLRWWSFFSPRHNFFWKQLHLHESRRSHYSRERSSFVSVVRLREDMLSVFVQSVTRWSAALSVPAVSCHHVRNSSRRVALHLSPCLHTTTPPTFFFFFFPEETRSWPCCCLTEKKRKASPEVRGAVCRFGEVF